MATSSLINSPLEQFEIRDLINFKASVLGNVNFSLTNIGLYLIIGLIIGLLFTELSLNISKVVATK
jgi:F-type H+-transporting ATPase subunit a